MIFQNMYDEVLTNISSRKKNIKKKKKKKKKKENNIHIIINIH